ncbi:MAG: hypothetical protein HYV55_00135 [Parcubacteria group bacterium]|nr:hypothetical protein [Parcubacteria group bacterium]
MKGQPVRPDHLVVKNRLLEVTGGGAESGYREIIRLVPREAAALKRALAASWKRVSDRLNS